MHDDERVRYAVAHLIAAVEKARAELEAQPLSRCRLAEKYKDEEDGEARRAFASWRDVDWEVREHAQLAREALGLAGREEADGEVFRSLTYRGYDDRGPEGLLEEARRRRIVQDRTFNLKSIRLEDLEGLDDFDPDGFQRGGAGEPGES